MANLADDDLLLVQRTSAGISTNYSITGSALKQDLGGVVNGLIVPPVEVLTPINGAGITEFDQYEPLSSAITAVGEAGTIAKETDAIQSVTDVSTGSVLFDGDDDYLSITGHSDLAFGTGDFTLEFWVYFSSSDPTLDTIMDSRSNSSLTDGFLIGRFHTPGHEGKIVLYTGGYQISSNSSVSDNTWVHVALVRNNPTTKLYINGVVQSETYSDSNNYSNGGLSIGQNVNHTYQIHGSISNFRMVKGTSVYTSNFLPPSTALSATTNTKLLCCQSPTDVTAATVSPGTITASSSPTAGVGPVSSKLLSFPTNTNFSGLSVGDVVKPGVSITSIDASATPPTVTVDGGTWTTSDHLTVSTPYETSLTFTDATELANMVAPLEMADATGGNSLIPTTSIVSSTAVIPAENLVYSENKFQYSGTTTYNTQSINPNTINSKTCCYLLF